jgi:N-acetylmuramoyl-L-alanine amidase
VITDRDYLALTLIGEARGEPIEGIIGVANVIKNRAYASGKLFKDVCLSPNQFSCWNENDPNKKVINQVYGALDFGNPITDVYLRQCIAVSSAVYEGDFLDNVKGAKNYVTLERYKAAQARKANKDKWINDMIPVIILGNHVFLAEKENGSSKPI